MRFLSYIYYILFYKHVLKLYLKTDSSITFDGFKLKVFKDVFHPKLFFSTKYFYSFIDQQPVIGLNFLEIGSGSGILSLLALKKKAKSVTSVDIDPKAVDNTRLNFTKNFRALENVNVFQSDLFENLPKQNFDFIVINPPYYFKKITAQTHYAWYCGENGEYFEKLFAGLPNYIHSETLVYMILEENCEIERIQSMALKCGIKFKLTDEKLIKWEKNFIFKLTQEKTQEVCPT
jgi:release factor glutamine methyltransferase